MAEKQINKEYLLEHLKNGKMYSYKVSKAYRLANRNNEKNDVSIRQYRNEDKALLDVFYSLIDKESATKLKNLKKEISLKSKSLESKTKWCFDNDYSHVGYWECENSNDPEFENYTAFSASYTEKGYVPCDNRTYFENSKSMSFCETHKIELDEIASLKSQIDEIMLGKYFILDDANKLGGREFLDSIAYELGCRKVQDQEIEKQI